MELILGKKFKLEVWETCLQTMAVGEVASFKVSIKNQSQLITVRTGSTKANGREPKSCLGQVFSFKLGCFCCGCKYNSSKRLVVGIKMNLLLNII
jgi:hypothetical protein